MKRLMIMAAAFAVCMLSMAQSEDTYSMQVYLSGGDVQSFLVSEVDSVVFVELDGYSSSDDASDDDTTSSDTTYVNGYAAVDLGLSVKWATCNIGAESPEDYGNYYAWGETETKDAYDRDNSVTYYGGEMDDIAGDTEYDAAAANWGSSWRMPTYEECVELVDSCTWEWTALNDVDGFLVTGSTGNSIFLPAVGDRNSTYNAYEGWFGTYWSSTPYASDTQKAWAINFEMDNIYVGDDSRYRGHSVRPVTE